MFFASYPALKKADVLLYVELFKQLRSLDISDVVLNEVLETHRKLYKASEMAEAWWAVAEGQKPYHEALESFKQLSEDEGKPLIPEIEFVTDDLQELYQQSYGRSGLRWKLRTLNKMMGSLRKGDFGFVYARPEVGKTTFITDQCGHFATCGSTVLHINNEEDGRKVKVRYYQSVLGLTTRELFSDFNNNRARYIELVSDRIRLVDRAAFSRREIEQIVEATNPGIIVLDSIDKISGFSRAEDTVDGVYKRIYTWARQLAKEYAPVIGVCHASVSGEGKKYLEMDDVAYAKTAKQGEADWILGIGKSNNPNDGEFTRYFHLPKNKLMGDEDSDESLRHGRLPVRILPEIAQYEDIHTFNEE